MNLRSRCPNRATVLSICVLTMAPVGCGDPPPTGNFAPPGMERDLVQVIAEDEEFKAQALGERGPDIEFKGSVEEIEGEVGIEVLEEAPEGQPVAQYGDRVAVLYRGTLAKSGKEFDRTRDNDPIIFRLIVPGMISGFVKGVVGMRVGERRQITVPPEMGYGEAGSPPKVPSNATLIFEVELVRIAEQS